MKRMVWLSVLLCGSYAAYGQQPPGSGSPCPAGMIPGEGGCFSPTDDSRFGQSSSAPAYTGPLWQDRYGAIALDSATGSIGWTSGAKSKKEAYRAAIADCGGGGCKIQAEGRNTCLAAAWGGAGGFAADSNQQKAETIALNNCKEFGGKNCKVQYSACSLPVRVR